MDDIDKVENRIKALTTLIHFLQPQIVLPKSGEQSSSARAYHCIATLLSHGEVGSNEVAVTGAHTVTGSIITVLSVDHAPLSLPDENLPDTQYQSTRTSTKFYKEAVKPTPPNLLETALKFRDTTDTITLSKQAADILQAINSTHACPIGTIEHSKMVCVSTLIVLVRCFPKIKHRVSGIMRLFGDDFITRLRSWTPEPNETLNFSRVSKSPLLLPGLPTGDIWVKIPSMLHAIFDVCSVPKQSRDDVLYYKFDAPVWVKCLLDLFFVVNEVACADFSLEILEDLYLSLKSLHVYIHSLEKFLGALFEIPSLNRLLYPIRCPGPESPDFDVELIRDPYESHGRNFLRYLESIVVWSNATDFLCCSRLSRNGLDLTVDIIRAQTPPNVVRMLPVQDLIDERLPRLVSKNRYDEVRTALLAEVKSPESDKFTGTVHCGAMLMSITTACFARQSDASLPADFGELFVESDGIIGLGKKCCWPCHYLAQQLESRQPHLEFPDTSGVVYPWAPPMGIPKDVLDKLDRELTNRLDHILDRFVQSKFPDDDSDSSSGNFDELECSPQ